MYYKCYTKLYTDIFVFYHIVLNDGQWSIEFVLNSNYLMSTDNYQHGILKQLAKGRRQWIELGTRQLQQITQHAQQDIEQLQQKLHDTQQQLQVSQQQFQQHLLKCHDTILTQPHQEERCRSFCDTCNISLCIFLINNLFIFLSIDINEMTTYKEVEGIDSTKGSK